MIPNFINPNYYLRILSDIVRFVIHPVEQPFYNKAALHKLNDLFIILIITLSLALSAFFFNVYCIRPEASMALLNWRLSLGPVNFFLFSVLLIPFIEELYYRLPLKFSPLFLSLSFVFVAYKFISKYYFNSLMYELASHPLERMMLALGSALVFYLIVSRDKIKTRLQLIWSRHFRWVFYISCLLFAFMHINNYVASTYTILLTPVITLPQLFLGLTAGYMRVQYGFWFAFLLHALYNSSPYWLPF